MIDPIDEEADKRTRERHHARSRPGAKWQPSEESQAKAQKKLGGEELEIPCPRVCARERDEELEGIADHRLALAEQKRAAGVRAIPERQLAVGPGARLHKRHGQMLPHHGAHIGHLHILKSRVRLARECRDSIVEQPCSVVR
jgi:hypothetical protein